MATAITVKYWELATVDAMVTVKVHTCDLCSSLGIRCYKTRPSVLKLQVSVNTSSLLFLIYCLLFILMTSVRFQPSSRQLCMLMLEILSLVLKPLIVALILQIVILHLLVAGLSQTDFLLMSHT